MRLKKITLLGFKSFADKTVLHFDAGMTCIVGPNGCGKSNISDAFRWVLGEQSAKSLRGNKMPDVIFSGTSNRKPLNFAEVSLTLTDIQGVLPIDYEEVTITRRLHRSGDSEYLLNGNSVRLKDLQALFLGSGIGRNAFSIFEQGKLDQVISYSPQERRYIFEEAAGILRFLQRKKEALRKLEQADLNLSRIQDIYFEVEKQIQTLEIQAKKALIFKEQKRELESLEKESFALRWQELEKKQSDLQAKRLKHQSKREESLQDFQFKQVKSLETKSFCQQHEKTLRAQSEHLLTLRSQQEIQSHECQSLQQRIKEIQLRDKKLKYEFEHLMLDRQTRERAMVELKKKRELLENEWSQAEAKWMDQQDRVVTLGKELAKQRQEVTNKQHEHLKSVQQTSQWQSEMRQAEVRLENLIQQESHLSQRLEQLKSDREQFSLSAKEKKSALQQLSGIVDVHKDCLDQFEDELRKLTLAIEEKQKELESLRRKVLEIKARQNVLLRMRDDFEGFSSGSKRLLQEAQLQTSPLFKTLRPFYEYVTPHSESNSDGIEALAVVLKEYSQTLVVQTEAQLQQVLDFADKEKLQDYSLLCLEWMTKFKQSFSCVNTELLNKIARNPISEHFLESTAVFSTIQEVLTAWIEGKCLEGWSVEGTFIDRHGVLFKIKPSGNQVFIRESELIAIEEELSQREELLIKSEKALQLLQQNRSQIQLERVELDKILRRDEMRLVEANFNLQRVLNDQEKNEGDQKRSEQELISLKKNSEEQKIACQKAEQQLALVNQASLQLEQEIEFLQQGLSRLESAFRIQEQDQKEKGSFYQELAANRQHLLHEYHLLEAKEQDFDKSRFRIEEELAELKEREYQSVEEEKRGRLNLTSLQTLVDQGTVRYIALEKEGDQLRKESELAEQHLSLQQEELKKIEQELTQLEIQYAHQCAISEALIEELSERYHLTVENLLKNVLLTHSSIEQIDKQIKGLRYKIQECGDVNLTAIEELEKHQERHLFLKKQIEDMQDSKEELLAIIQQLDGETHKLFKESFEAIRANFQKNFSILFSGGEADLQFTDSEDILEAGIEIIAKPPGKQMRSISLLSGGEKCLTAVALLFAIFEVKPAPFCILDEIDAPLDDTNVERFVNVVKHFADRCQFLIITHNKRTMAIGDTIFGVSMEEKGVSKLLSLEFAREADPVASLV